MLSDIIAALLFATLAGMGIGGGGLLVIYLTLVKDYPSLDARALNLLFFICAAASSLLVHTRRRKLDARLISVFAVTGIVGSLAGSTIASYLPADITNKLFGVMLIISGVITLFRIRAKPLTK